MTRSAGSEVCNGQGGLSSSYRGVRATLRACHRPHAPLLAPPAARLLDEPLRASFTPEFLATLMSNAELVRHVAVVGALHHGKTTIMDMLVEQVGGDGCVLGVYWVCQVCADRTNERWGDQGGGLGSRGAAPPSWTCL